MADYIHYRPDRPIRLQNKNCPYCGCKFDDTTVTNEEHAVGRRFVPKASTQNQINLIFRTCKKCNEEKSQLEDDISVISMFPRNPNRGLETELILSNEVARKAGGAGSRRTNRSVATSEEHLTLQRQFGGANLSFGFIAPPQIDIERIYRLAQFHFDAFFYEATYDAKLGIGGFFPHKHHHNVGYFPMSNWGANKAKWFMAKTVVWQTIAVIVTAQGFFKLIIRQSPCKAMWACAVEWNQSMRVMRLLGIEFQSLQDLVNTSPKASGSWYVAQDGSSININQECTLDPEDDTLFKVVTHDLD